MGILCRLFAMFLDAPLYLGVRHGKDAIYEMGECFVLLGMFHITSCQQRILAVVTVNMRQLNIADVSGSMMLFVDFVLKGLRFVRL